MILGGFFALITTFVEFPGRRFADYLAFIPLAIPSYITGFVIIDFFDYSSFFNRSFRRLFGGQGWDPSGFDGVCIAMAISLFPYSFLLIKNALYHLDSKILEAARVLNPKFFSIFFSVLIPLLSTSMLCALFIIIIEVLSDYATVTLFSVDTLSTAVFKSWLGFFDISGAMRLATMLLSVAFLCYIFCHFFDTTRSKWHNLTDSSHHLVSIKRIELSKTSRIVMSCVVFTLLSIPSIFPVIALVIMVIQEDFHFRMIAKNSEVFVQSLILAIIVSLVVAMLSVNIISLERFGWFKTTILKQYKKFLSVINYGYALPSTVLAIAIYGLFTYITNQIDSVFGWDIRGFGLDMTFLIIALIIHFYSVGFNVISDGYEKLSRDFDEAAQALGSGKIKMFFTIHLPLLVRPLQLAVILVSLDVIKDIPISLMLRPIGWETLSVKIYELSSEGLWYKAAFPSLLLVAICVVLLTTVYIRFPKFISNSS